MKWDKIKTRVIGADKVKFDYDSMPEHKKNTLARHTLHAVERYFKQPGVQEAYEAWLPGYLAEQEAKRRGGEMNGSTDCKSNGSNALANCHG